MPALREFFWSIFCGRVTGRIGEIVLERDLASSEASTWWTIYSSISLRPLSRDRLFISWISWDPIREFEVALLDSSLLTMHPMVLDGFYSVPVTPFFRAILAGKKDWALDWEGNFDSLILDRCFSLDWFSKRVLIMSLRVSGSSSWHCWYATTSSDFVCCRSFLEILPRFSIWVRIGETCLLRYIS